MPLHSAGRRPCPDDQVTVRILRGGVKDRPIAGRKRADRGWRCEQVGMGQRTRGLPVTAHGPFESPPTRDHVAGRPGRHDCPVRQPIDRHKQRMQPFAAIRQPFAMQHLVHPGRRRPVSAIADRPGAAELLRSVAPAKKARTMSSRQCRRFVEEEELGPAAAAHHVASNALVVARADDPSLCRPPARQKRPRPRIVNDAAVAHEQSALGDRNDLAEGRHPNSATAPLVSRSRPHS